MRNIRFRFSDTSVGRTIGDRRECDSTSSASAAGSIRSWFAPMFPAAGWPSATASGKWTALWSKRFTREKSRSIGLGRSTGRADLHVNFRHDQIEEYFGECAAKKNSFAEMFPKKRCPIFVGTVGGAAAVEMEDASEDRLQRLPEGTWSFSACSTPTPPFKRLRCSWVGWPCR